MRSFWALFSNKRAAKPMRILHVFPPIFRAVFLIDALFSEVLHHDFSSGVLIVRWVDRAIFAVRPAVFAQNFVIALFALPINKPRGELHVSSEALVVTEEIEDKIQRAIVGGRVPEVVLHAVVWVRDRERNREDDLVHHLRRSLFKVLHQLFAVVFGDN